MLFFSHTNMTMKPAIVSIIKCKILEIIRNLQDQQLAIDCISKLMVTTNQKIYVYSHNKEKGNSNIALKIATKS